MENRLSKFLLLLLLILFSYSANAQNVRFSTFQESKYKMYGIYHDYKKTFYCNAEFDNKRNIILPNGMKAPKNYKNRQMMEWEHIVPAENFGRTFKEWRNAKSLCKIRSKRECARRLSEEFNYMEADMYNLYPSIGFINAMRSNFNFAELREDTPNAVKGCNFKMYKRSVEPAEHLKGIIARTYFYMEDAYPRYKISDKMKKTLQIWDKKHPVEEWECERAKRIEAIQGNTNKFVKEPCKASGLW